MTILDDDLAKLDGRQKIAYCQVKSHQMMELAQTAGSAEARCELLDLAAQWSALRAHYQREAAACSAGGRAEPAASATALR